MFDLLRETFIVGYGARGAWFGYRDFQHQPQQAEVPDSQDRTFELPAHLHTSPGARLCSGDLGSLLRGGQTVAVASETDGQRVRREQWRCLFDGIAGLYDAARPGYPAEIVDAVCAIAGIGPGAGVLEVGCGTGQLTRQLAGRSFELTAIDIGPAMIAAARRNVADPMARFHVCAFEQFAGHGPFDLIVSATAFHWVDPGIGLAKAARLLRPGGWLALLSTEERYPEPLRTALRELWATYSRGIVRTARQPAWVTGLCDTTLFGEPVEQLHTRAARLPAQAVVAVERTRATFLSYSKCDQAGFTADLTALLHPSPHVDLVRETLLAMAPVTT
jgi:ubiquinone/menaquinone biosynthesis C-methylase UbiE